MLWRWGKHKPLAGGGEKGAVRLCQGPFYHRERPLAAGRHLLHIRPCIEDDDPTFPRFMRVCGGRLLAPFPFVVEQVASSEDAARMPFIAEYRAKGGRTACLEPSTLSAISGLGGPRLLPLLPEDDLLREGYCGYGYERALLELTRLETSPFSLRIFCHETHDYMEIETPGEPQGQIDTIRTLCGEEGWELVEGVEEC